MTKPPSFPAFINESHVGDTNTSSATTLSHNSGVGGTRMIVDVYIRRGLTVASVSTITFGATSLSVVITTAISDTNRWERWEAVVAESTTDTVTVTYTGSASNACVAVRTYRDVGSLGTSASNAAASGAGSLQASVDGTNALVVDMYGAATNPTLTPDGGQAEEFTQFQDGAGQCKLGGSRKTGSGTTTMGWANSNGTVPHGILVTPLVA